MLKACENCSSFCPDRFDQDNLLQRTMKNGYFCFLCKGQLELLQQLGYSTECSDCPDHNKGWCDEQARRSPDYL